jgi:hypothetical protein
MTGEELARKEAWRSAVWASSLDVGAGVLVALALRDFEWRPLWPLLQFTAAGAVILTVLLIWRNAPRGICLAFLSLDFASALVTSLAASHFFVHAGVVTQLFQTVKMSALVIAILSPSARLGAAWVALFSAAPLVQVALWPAEVRAALPPGEPWFAPIYGAIALTLLLYRRRSLDLERALAETRGREMSIARLAQVSLAVRDLANTPLQTLTTGVDLLRHKASGSEAVIESMARALVRLEKLRQALAPFEQHVEWRPHDESFDAVARLEEMASDLSRPAREGG